MSRVQCCYCIGFKYCKVVQLRGSEVVSNSPLLHHRAHNSCVYNGCLVWYNVVLTPRIHSTVKYRQLDRLGLRLLNLQRDKHHW